MIFRTSLKQTLRTPVKLIAYFLITALAAGFLCVGLNLEKNAQANLVAANAVFTTVAVPDFQAHLDYEGRLCTALNNAGYKGYAPCAAQEYDLSPIQSAVGVEHVEARSRFGVRVNGAEPLKVSADGALEGPHLEDVILFTVDAEEPITVYPNTPQPLSLSVLFSARGLTPQQFRQPVEFASSIRADMLEDMPYPGKTTAPAPPFEIGTEAKDGSFVLEPGRVYIANCELRCSIPFSQQGERGGATVYYLNVCEDEYHRGFRIRFDPKFGWSEDKTPSFQPYLPIAPYEEGFFETERGAFFQEIIDAYEITANSLNAVATSDMAAMRPFHSSGVRIAQGRPFSEEDYVVGAKVCLVSEYVAELNGWQVGDTLSLSFYETKYLFGEIYRTPSFRMPAEGFFDEGEFTIVGLYAGNVIRDFTGARAYSKGDTLDAKDVLIPASAVSNAPAPELSQHTTTIRLDKDETQAFLAEMAASGLMEEQPGGYELGLTVYDQGYSHVAPGLEQLSRVSRLMLLLSLATAGAAALALALIHVLRMRRELAAMRSLGTKKGQIAGVALLGVLLVCLLGAAAGAYAGHALSTEVAEHVLAGAEADAADRAFTAMMGEETAKEFAFTLESDAALAFASGGGVAAAFLLLALLLLAAELRRPPMALLAVRE